MSPRAGFVTILGRPNAGKSTLVNYLVGRKVSIVSPRPQTTRNRIQGILNHGETQIVFIDTPGLVKPASLLDRQMMDEIAAALEGIDAVALLVDAHEKPGRGDKFALDIVRRFRGPAILLLNKIDLIAKQKLLPLISYYQAEHNFAEIIPISALTGDGLPIVTDALAKLLPEGPPIFPPDQYTDAPERFLAAETIREKAILATREEVPYAIAVLTESFDESPGRVRIRATLYVERDGQKGILIGKGGETLKHIGTEARLEIEQLLGVKVFLELFVKVQHNWRENPTLIRHLDWRRQLESLSDHQQ